MKDIRKTNYYSIKKSINPNETRNKLRKDIKLDYSNLMNGQIQLIFKEYRKETGNYPNYGPKFRKDFMKWAKNYAKLNNYSEILPKIEAIYNNKEIYNFIINKIENSHYSHRSISRLLEQTGIYVNSKTIGKVSNKIEFEENSEISNDRSSHIYAYHPKIKLNYFKEIDTKEKAYWLGFIYADGGLSYLTPNKRFIRFHFGLDIKDKDSREMVYHLANTLGIEKEYVKPCSRGNMLRFVITNNILAFNLNEHGVIIGKRKSKNIELPEFNSRELNLSFLLGYYDGDGTEGSTVITSGSKKFLEQIKKKYSIAYELRYKKSESIINGKKVNGEGWDLALGANLFNDMMRNYQSSMPRKRKIFETPKEKSERMKQACINRAKLKINNNFLENLKKLVWEMPLYKIANAYNISVSRISDFCKQYQIDKPPIGYWKKKLN
ncbi:MAG: hypothetical protein ACFFDH_02350 [Promethearchaeota archaeon]